MANDMNVVSLIGRLTRESEMTYTTGGTAISKFSLAVNRRKKSGDKYEDEVSYFDCTLFGKSAESLNQYLEKGRQVSIVGELRQERWEQEGQSRSKVSVVVNSLQLLGESKNGSQQAPTQQNAQGYQNSRAQAPQRQYSQQQSFQGNGYNQPRRPSGPPSGQSGNYSQPQYPDSGYGPEQFNDDIPF